MNKKIADDIYQEAKRAQVLVHKIQQGDVAVKPASKQVRKALENIINSLPFREDES